MPPSRAPVSYKKQNGVIAISKDRKSVSWTPSQPPDASPSLVVSASNITNLQQTPESSAKIMLKVFAQAPGQTEPVSHVFTFISKEDPRSEANAIKDALTSVIQAQKAAQNAVGSEGGQSAAMTIANVVAGGRQGNAWEDDERLKSDVRLQQSLMNSDPALQKTFMEAVSLKPESISAMQFTTQFWSSRVNLLRAHAIMQNQGRGRYNVFSELRKEEGGTKMNLTQDHVRAIFEQYPVMRIVYDELVPQRIKSEAEFWSRFFQSQLFMILRGLKIDRDKEAKDRDLDKFLDRPELTGLQPTSTEMHIPKFIDLEGNEQNHSQKQGNRPDQELRTSNLDKAPIIRRLNALSEKLMASARPSGIDASAPIGMDEATYESLRLRDLAGDPEQNKIILNIRDQSRFFSDNREDDSISANPLHSVDPMKAVQDVLADFTSKFPQSGTDVIPIENFRPFSEHDDPSEIGNGSLDASTHITSLIQTHRDQTTAVPESSGLPGSLYESLTLTHATTLEFLRQFWAAFLSASASPRRHSVSNSTELKSLVESLNKSLDRINAIADEAEKERNKIIRIVQGQADEVFKKTGRRRRVDLKAIGGGAVVVRHLLGPVIRSLDAAVQSYRRAVEQES